MTLVHARALLSIEKISYSYSSSSSNLKLSILYPAHEPRSIVYTKCIQIILKFLLLAKLKKVRNVYLRAVRSPGTKRVQFVKENHTRCRISCPLKYLPDSSLTLTYILRYNTEKDFFSRWEMRVKKNSISSCS